MCWCTPEIRTPCCGKENCHPPTFKGPKGQPTMVVAGVDVTITNTPSRRDGEIRAGDWVIVKNMAWRNTQGEVLRVCGHLADVCIQIIWGDADQDANIADQDANILLDK